MKVLVKGKPQKEWSIKRTCTGKGNDGGGCGAKLLVSKSDLFRTSSSSYDGSSDHYITFQCPECKVLTDIPDSLVSGFYHEILTKQAWMLRQTKSDKNDTLLTCCGGKGPACPGCPG